MEKVIIDQPCKVDWNGMTPNKEGRYCSVCETTVVDFTKMTLEDINAYFKSNFNKKTCGKYHERHASPENKWYSFLNDLEFLFTKLKLKGLAIVLIYLLLLLTGCRTKRTQGVRRLYVDMKNSKLTELFPAQQDL